MKPSFFIALILLGLNCCRKDEGPCLTCPAPPTDPRNYSWTLDTIAYPGSFQTFMFDIWGSSAKDVYIVGHNDQNWGLMWQFDGSKWIDVKLSTGQGGTIAGPIDLQAVYGFSSNDVWAVGEHIMYNPSPPPNFLDSSLIIHFDGAKWAEYKVTRGRLLSTVFGVSPSDGWAGGGFGTLFHFDGIRWTKYAFPDTVHIRSISGIASNDVFVLAYKTDSVGLATLYLFHWNGSLWSILDQFKENPFSEDKFGARKLRTVDGELYSVGRGVYKKVTGGWLRMFGPPRKYFNAFCGQSTNNLFTAGYYGLAYHFNGMDWFQYQQLYDEQNQYYGSWTNGREVFVLGSDAGGSKSYVFHGK